MAVAEAGSALASIDPVADEIPVFGGCGLKLSAGLAGFFPLSCGIFSTTTVKPLVFSGVNKREIGKLIVEFVSVDVVDLLAFWDGSVGGFPDEDVLHPDSLFPLVVDASVSFGGDEAGGWFSVWSAWHGL